MTSTIEGKVGRLRNLGGKEERVNNAMKGSYALQATSAQIQEKAKLIILKQELLRRRDQKRLQRRLASFLAR